MARVLIHVSYRLTHSSAFSFSCIKLLPKSASTADCLTHCVTLIINKTKNPFQVNENKVGILHESQVRGSTFLFFCSIFGKR
jgi:hypothetical protein